MTSMIRPPYRPDNDEQRRLIAEAKRLANLRRCVDHDMWVAILKARVAGVPDEVLCNDIGESRATLNRRYRSRSNMAVRWRGDNLDEVRVLRPDARLAEADDGDIRKGDLLVEHTKEPGHWVVVGLHQSVFRRDV